MDNFEVTTGFELNGERFFVGLGHLGSGVLISGITLATANPATVKRVKLPGVLFANLVNKKVILQYPSKLRAGHWLDSFPNRLSVELEELVIEIETVLTNHYVTGPQEQG